MRDSFMIESYKILKNLVKNIEIFVAFALNDRCVRSTVLKGKDIAIDGLEIQSEDLMLMITKEKLKKLFKEFTSLS